jgi:hypothetical protein
MKKFLDTWIVAITTVFGTAMMSIWATAYGHISGEERGVFAILVFVFVGSINLAWLHMLMQYSEKALTERMEIIDTMTA